MGSRQLSRNSRPATEDGDTNQGQLLGGSPSEDDSCCNAFITGLFCCFLCLTGILFFVIPVIMIAVGATFYEQCALNSPYPLWLVVVLLLCSCLASYSWSPRLRTWASTASSACC